MPKVKTDNFRTDLSDFFSMIFETSQTAKQNTPFIVITSKEITGTHYTCDILEMHSKTKILRAWPGKWSTDVFSFTAGQMKEWIKESNRG